MIDAIRSFVTHEPSPERGQEVYAKIQRQLIERSLIFASFLDITSLARFRGWKTLRYPELENLLRFFEIPQDAFDADGVSAFTHIAVDHYADILHATGTTRQVLRAPVPKRLEHIAPTYASSIHSDLVHILARPPEYIDAVRQSLQKDPTGAAWLLQQIAIDEKIEPPTPSQHIMMQGAVTGARKLFNASKP